MDLRNVYLEICILLQMFLVITSTLQEKDCRQCKPGYHASRQCSDLHDTVCSPCPNGTFTSVHNKFSQCNSCSKCDAGEFVSVECTKHSDTVCESCSATLGKLGVHFYRECLQNDQADAGLTPVGEGDSTVVLSSEQTLPKDVQLIEEGSGVSETLPEQTGEHKYPVVNGTEEEEVEGSGETVIIDPTEEGQNATHVILPDVETNKTDIDTIIGGGANVTITVGEGIDLSEPESKNVTDVALGELRTSTTKTINLGPGPVVDSEKPIEEPTDNIDVYITPITDFEPDAEPGHDNALTGSSHNKQSEERSGVSIGVVVTVGLVAALVFFILGFIANRIWSSRRDRSFNVQEAERRNGKAGVECSKVEYKDPESQRTKGNIYPDLSTDPKQNGKGGSGGPSNKVELGPIYTKPLKRNSFQPKDDKTQSGTGNPKGNESTARPPSEIKYMDEEAEEAPETAKLLAPEQPSGSKSTPKSSQNGISDKHGSSNGDIPDEKTPMIEHEK